MGTSGDGGKFALVGMESREGGEAVISALHLTEVKDREITVRWKEAEREVLKGMWTCPDPACRKINFDKQDKCFRCGLNRGRFAGM